MTEERVWVFREPTTAETTDGYAMLSVVPGIVSPSTRSFRAEVYICIHSRLVLLDGRWFDNVLADTYEDVQAIALTWAKGKVAYYTCFRQ